MDTAFGHNGFQMPHMRSTDIFFLHRIDRKQKIFYKPYTWNANAFNTEGENPQQFDLWRF